MAASRLSPPSLCLWLRFTTRRGARSVAGALHFTRRRDDAALEDGDDCLGVAKK